jgi:hypothetical protein
MVEASADAKKKQEQQRQLALQTMAREHAEQWAHRKTMAATFSGGSFGDPDADVDDKLPQQADKRRATESPSAATGGFFGLGAAAQSGVVSASKSAAAAAKPAEKQGTPAVSPNEQGWARKVFDALVRVDERSGHVSVPTYDEVARGGFEVVGVIKRNAAGEAVEVQETRPRFRQPQKIGPQHLYPDLVAELCAPFQRARADPDQDSTLEMVELGARLPVARDEGGRARQRSAYVTRDGDATQYSTNFYWVRPDLRATGAAL